MSEQITEVAETSTSERERHRGPRDPGPVIGDANVPTWFKITASALAPAAVAAFFPVPHAVKLTLLGIAGAMLVTGLVMVVVQRRRA